MTVIPFEHRMAAHCESGTVTRLFNHAGIPVSEAMVFGIAGGIFFGYFHNATLPFPTFVLRNKPGKIKSKSAKRLGVHFETTTFSDPDRAMKELDELLERNVPVAVQVDFFYMDYIPEYARAHFNAHYITVVGKKRGRYVISDSYAPALVTLDGEILKKARFVRGPFSPKGRMFYHEGAVNSIDYSNAIRKGIKDATFFMLRIPLPFLGVRGIRHFAKKVLGWSKYSRDIEHLSHEIMMIHVILEERGTGGGGFRFLYATFLQEASKILDNQEMAAMSKVMMENGDRWRDISLFVARIGKQRDLGPDRLQQLSDMILERADKEKEIFTRLRKIV